MEAKTTVREFIEAVETGHCNIIEVAKSVLADGKESVRLELCQKVEMPLRAESPRRAHTFFDAGGFAAYLTENRPENGRLVVLIDTDSLIAKAVLDDTAKNGFEVIAFQPPYHPIFTLINEALFKPQEVRRFADGVVRCRQYIIGMDGKPCDGMQLSMLMRQVSISNCVSIESGSGNNAVNGVMVTTKVKAGQAVESKIDLPESLRLRTPIFMTGQPVEMNALLTLTPLTAEKIVIGAEVPELKVIIREEFDKMLVDVHQMQGAQVSFGQVQHLDWKYCK